MDSRKSLFFLLVIIGLLSSVYACNNNNIQLAFPGKTVVTRSDNQTSKTPQSSLAEFDMKKSARLTDSAKFLAGMEVKDTRAIAFGGMQSVIAKLTQSSIWRTHAASFDKAWAQLEAQQLSKVRRWAGEELKLINQTSQPIFYPFSGPDFLYAYSFFPNSREYVLVGLEPIGELPNLENLSPSEMKLKLQGINASVDDILGLSFFRTNDMKVDLAKQGVLPILSVFMARTHHRILDVQYISLDKEGNIQALPQKHQDKSWVPGVKISFVKEGTSQAKTLYYFSTDLSDSGLKKTPGFNKFVKNIDNPVSYLKAASYLMHDQHFSTIRNVILSQSTSLLQDDSGIPVKYFGKQKWNLKLYGNYTQPIALFNKRYQTDLKKMYNSDRKIKPLNFGIGYNFKVNQSNLMLAIALQGSPFPRPAASLPPK